MGSINQYKLIERLGDGAYGVVYKAVNTYTNNVYTIKAINISRMTSGQIQMVENEISAMMDISNDEDCSKFIVCYYNSFNEIIKGEQYKIIVMEYIEGEELFSFINKRISNKEKLQPDEILQWMEYLLFGLSRIHDKGYAHRDIKLENIIINKEQGVIKIIDLGFACSSDCENTVGTKYYLPPEFIIDELKSNGLEAAQAHDVWSLGIIFYILANLSFPFETTKTIVRNASDGSPLYQKVPIDRNEFMNLLRDNKIYKSSYSYQCSSDSRRYKKKILLINNIINSMLTRNWTERPNIFDMLELLNKESSRSCILN
jgi:serine/threonine protein kinase